MKELIYIFLFLLLLGSCLSFLDAADQVVIAKDSLGIVVEFKEIYGNYTTDTGTVLLHYKNNFVLVKRDTQSSWYPASRYSIRAIKGKSK